MGSKELLSMAEEDGQAEGRCHFCNAVYLVGKDRLLDSSQGQQIAATEKPSE